MFGPTPFTQHTIPLVLSSPGVGNVTWGFRNWNRSDWNQLASPIGDLTEVPRITAAPASLVLRGPALFHPDPAFNPVLDTPPKADATFSRSFSNASDGRGVWTLSFGFAPVVAFAIEVTATDESTPTPQRATEGFIFREFGEQNEFIIYITIGDPADRNNSALFPRAGITNDSLTSVNSQVGGHLITWLYRRTYTLQFDAGVNTEPATPPQTEIVLQRIDEGFRGPSVTIAEAT